MAGLPQKFWCTNLLSFLSGVAGVAEYWKVCKVRRPGSAAVVSPLSGRVRSTASRILAPANKRQDSGFIPRERRRNEPTSRWVTFALLAPRRTPFFEPQGVVQGLGGLPQIRSRHEDQATLDFFKGLYMMELSEMPVEVRKQLVLAYKSVLSWLRNIENTS